MIEIWLPVIGFKGKYEVSNFGRVRSLDRLVKGWRGRLYLRKGQILKPQVAAGYEQVYFMVNGKQKWFKVHRLVAEAFLDNPANLPCINHKDENPLNNRVYLNEDGSVDLDKSNLEWCSFSYNVCYIDANIKRGKKRREKFQKKLDELGLTREEYEKKRQREYYLQNREKIIARNLDYYYKKRKS